MDDLSRRDTMSFETDTDYDYEDMYYDNPPQEDAEEYSAAVSGSIEKRRKKRNRKKRRKKRLGLWILIIIAVIVLAVLFGRSSYFNIDEIQVKGNHYYTDEQIISMAGAQTGINTFSAGTGNMEKLLCDDSYIATADVKRKLPNVLEITIRERTETAAVYSEKNYYIVDGSGYILKVTAERPDVTRVLGLTVKNGKEGEALEVKESRMLTETLDVLIETMKGTVSFKKIKVSNTVLRAYIYNHLIVRGTAANISECISSGKLEGVLYDLYERGIKNGMISVGDDQYCVFSPKIK